MTKTSPTARTAGECGDKVPNDVRGGSRRGIHAYPVRMFERHGELARGAGRG